MNLALFDFDGTITVGDKGDSWWQLVLRCGSARCALRHTHRPQDRGFSLGFRAVTEPASAEREAG